MLALANYESADLVLVKTSCEIVHTTIGRVRIRLPRVASDRDYASKLQQALASIPSVTEVRINPLAESVIVAHDSSLLLDYLFVTIDRADSLVLLPGVPVESIDNPSIEEWFTLIAETGTALLRTLGTLSMMIGIAGLVLPLIPGTPFLLLSSLCLLALSTAHSTNA
jgi:Heavy metal associated domain 2